MALTLSIGIQAILVCGQHISVGGKYKHQFHHFHIMLLILRTGICEVLWFFS